MVRISVTWLSNRPSDDEFQALTLNSSDSRRNGAGWQAVGHMAETIDAIPAGQQIAPGQQLDDSPRLGIVHRIVDKRQDEREDIKPWTQFEGWDSTVHIN
jgi:hypothetical protein